MYQIVQHEQLSPNVFRWEVMAPDVAKAARPGQFIILRLHEGGERIPLTIADFSPERGTITLVIQALGKTTNEMMRNYKSGDWIRDFAGPLGKPSEIEPDMGHVVLVGGGLGVAPIYPQLRAFQQAGNRTTSIIGFRNEDSIFWEDRYREWSNDLIVCTDDGSYGVSGFVTVALQQLLEEQKPDMIVAIGPLPMMKACAEVSRPFGVKTITSLNAIMVDGTGMCGSCRVTVGGEIRFACVDGPEFDAHLVDFDELIIRQRRFKRSEHEAQDDYDHVCQVNHVLFEEGKRNYKKIRQLPPHAVPMPQRDPVSRAQNFREVNLGYSWADALEEAERCIQCKRPQCISGCPVSVDIPGFIRHILVRDVNGALDVIHRTNLFPSICGRVCPQEAQCEAQCILGRKVELVAIGRLERFVGDHARASQVTPPANAGELGRVAIVGSGPGGLACAADLAKAGAKVTVFEALHTPGGVLSYGIPSFRLPRETIHRELQALDQLGVEIQTNQVVGKVFTLDQLMAEKGFDAVFVATGSGYPKFLGIPGENAGMVYSANEFLTRVNLMGGDRFPLDDTPVNIGKKVIVLGAGNTAMDCLRVSKRVGSETVQCLYRRSEAEAPARAEELRHAKEEGILFHFLHSPVEILLDDEQEVRAIRAERMELGPPDDSGRRRPIGTGEYSEFECDMIIYALGTRANPIIAQATPDLATHWGNYIQADPETQATNKPGVFAGGDIVTGGATVILALGAGRRAAVGIQAWLRTREWPPDLEALKRDPAEDGPRVQATPHRVATSPQPLDGEGDGMHIGPAPVIHYHCTECHKVYEGFAFPYGLCPACGGVLDLRQDRPDTASAEAQDAIRHALEIELGGMAFYKRGAEQASDPELGEFFHKLHEMEAGHNQLLRERYQVETPEPELGKLPIAQVAVYAGYVLSDVTDGEGLLGLAVRLENRARDFFAQQKGRLDPKSDAWRLYAELEAEETEHVALLETELARYKEGKAGLL